ncbi:MAG: right-handed parallel beta-helix repeat-containing protein [Methylococcales bacterium]
MAKNKKLSWLLVLVITISALYGSAALSETMRVPADFNSIQAAIDAAADGDVVLVSSGLYKENINITNKSIVLASKFHTTGESRFIGETIIDGKGGQTAVLVKGKNTNPIPTIVGFTIRNASNGVEGLGPFKFLNNRVIETNDGIDYESGSGGLVRDSVFENNEDDGIDLDGSVEVVIEKSLITNNDDDGIEIRLHDYTGPKLNVVIRDNEISNNGEDGIQLIDDDNLSSRVFLIERNLIRNNAFAGLGMMCCMDTKEDFQGADIRELITLANNTFVGNKYGVTGGDNVVALNNLIVDTANIGLKNVDGQSMAAYNLLFGNGEDNSSSNIDLNTTVFEDPQLNSNHEITPSSPAVDSGTNNFEHNGDAVQALSNDFKGAAPDIGHVEVDGVATEPVTPPEEPVTPPEEPVTPPVDGETSTISIPILAREDGVEEEEAGNVVVGSYDLDLGRRHSNVIAGMRFNELTIPQGAEIVSAYIQFTARKDNDYASSLLIEGEGADNAAIFDRLEEFNLSSRNRTSAVISWSPASWNAGESGTEQKTPDLSSVLQEIMNRAGWESGNSAVLFISGQGRRQAQSFDLKPSNAPVLHVTYQ